MGLLDFLNNRVSANTQRLNRIEDNAKANPEFEQQDPIEIDSKIRVSKENESKTVTVEQIISEANKGANYQVFIIKQIAQTIGDSAESGTIQIKRTAGNKIEAILFDANYSQFLLRNKQDVDSGKTVYMVLNDKTTKKRAICEITAIDWANVAETSLLVTVSATEDSSVFIVGDSVEVAEWNDDLGEDVDLSNYMLKSTFDPTGKNADTFDMDNMVESATKKIFTNAERDKLTGLDQAIILKGNWDASAGTFPSSTEAGWSYIVSAIGTVDGIDFKLGDRLISILDGASTTVYAGNWFKSDGSDLGMIAEINAAASQPTPLNASIFGYLTSLGALVKTTWADILATLKTYFDTLYRGKTDIVIVATGVSGTYNIDWNNDVYDLELSGDTTLTETNVQNKTLLLIENPNGFALTYPNAEWSTDKTGERSLTLQNTHVNQSYNGKYKRQITQPT